MAWIWKEGRPVDKAAFDSLAAAMDGDTRALENRLQDGSATFIELRLLADWLKNPKRPRHRQPSVGVQLRCEAVEEEFKHAIASGKEISIKSIMADYRISRSEAYAILAKVRVRGSTVSNATVEPDTNVSVAKCARACSAN